MRRLRAFGAAALVAFLTACGSGATPAPSTSSVPTSARSSSITTLAASQPDVAAEDVLASALATTRTGYLFESTVAVDGRVVTAMTGRIDDGGMEATVSSGGADIEYLATDSGRWSRRGGGAWRALTGDVPFSDPLAVLLAPDSVSGGAGGSILVASYPAAALGIDGAGPVPVEIAVDGGRIAQLHYTVPAGDGSAEVTTVLSPLGTTTPVTAPAA